ncbi:prephenate dehydrogenase [Streptomyces pseudovenezuelae]|uniref:prephenate dehydrogenase n=1 Tax=Streptomyces pseudovenezuelae TaxID=67350 RepID=UPI002E80FE00|nr:prephenate dehydrogenase [Streptomyces pseudovenezuelae]WUA86296.1 prephenate dehydrogenase [Streptomyces pseudovenezuelae]
MKTVAVVGTGAIGTSVALALTKRGLTVHLEDVNATAVRTAEAMGAGSVGTPAERVDLAVIAVPPAHTGSVLEQLQRRGLAHAYTDVASVKTLPYDDLRLAGAEPASFIGGHPLAGTDRSGPLAARADVFEDRPWILTPSARTDQSVLNRALELVSLCSGVPVIMDPLVHDRTLALTSHAPQLISTLMAATLVDAAEADIRVAGQGLRNVAGSGGGDPDLWRDIFTANADALADVLDAYAADLGRAVGALRALGHADDEVRERAEGELETLLRHGHRGRARVAGPASSPAEVRLSVALSDRPGTLARLFGAVEELGGRIEDVRLENAQGLPYGSVSLCVPQTSVADLSRLLRAGGWATLMVALPDAPHRATRPAEPRDPVAVEVRADGTG